MCKKNSSYKAHRATILLGVMVLFSLFLAGFSFAAEFDNVKDYDPIRKEVTIKDNFGLGDELAKIQLNTPQVHYVMRGKDRLVAEFTIDSLEDYTEVFNKMEFFDINNNDEKITRSFDYKRKVITSVTVPKYYTDCVILKNESEQCSQIENGTKEESTASWIPISKQMALSKEKITIGVFTDVFPDDHIEWIPTLYGVEIDEWAEFTEGLKVGLQHYWAFDDASGTNVIDSRGDDRADLTQYNGSIVYGTPDWRAGKLNGGLYFDQSTGINFTGVGSLPQGTENFTVAFWLNLTVGDPGAPSTYWIMDNMDNNQDEFTINYAPSIPRLWAYTGGAAPTYCDSNNWTGTGLWTHVVWTRNKSGSSYIYVNGQGCFTATTSGTIVRTQMNLGFRQDPDSPPNDRFIPDAMLDEFGIWNRSLTSSEISALWNGGEGLFFLPQNASSVTINLISPSNNTIQSNNDEWFSANATCVSCGAGELINGTVRMFYTNGTLALINSTAATTQYNETNLSLSNIPINSLYWNYEYCFTNSTGDLGCGFSQINRTYSRNLFDEIAFGFNGNTTEGSTERFSLNISLEAGSSISETRLFYNNTQYDAAFTDWGSNNIELYTTIVVDAVPVESLLTFYWELNLASGQVQNSSAKGQTVKTLGIDDCSTNPYVVYNFTIVDEQTQTKLNPTNFNTTGKVDITMYSLNRQKELVNFSKLFNKNNSFAVCLTSNLSGGAIYSIDSQVQYDADNYVPEFYHIVNNTLTASNLYTNITLYDLINTSSTTFTITYKDSNFIAVKDAVIQVLRNYVDEGVFKTVEAPKTDENGETLAHLQAEDTEYTFIVVKNGKVLGTFTNYLASCESEVLGDCEINLNSFGSHTEPQDFTTLDDFIFSLSYNNNTRTVSTTYSIPSGTVSTVLLNVTLYDNIGTNQVCTSSLTSTAGTVSCIVPNNFGNGTVIATIYKDGTEIAKGFVSLAQKPGELYGNNLVFLSLFLFLTLIGVGINNNPMITGFFLILGAILAVGINIVSSGTSSFIGAGATILWLFVAIIIVLIKGQNRG